MFNPQQYKYQSEQIRDKLGAVPVGGFGGVPNYGLQGPPTIVEEPWAVTQWTEYYVPTVRGGGRMRRPVIYVAAPFPGASPYGGFGGMF